MQIKRYLSEQIKDHSTFKQRNSRLNKTHTVRLADSGNNIALCIYQHTTPYKSMHMHMLRICTLQDPLSLVRDQVCTNFKVQKGRDKKRNKKEKRCKRTKCYNSFSIQSNQETNVEETTVQLILKTYLLGRILLKNLIDGTGFSKS